MMRIMSYGLHFCPPLAGEHALAVRARRGAGLPNEFCGEPPSLSLARRSPAGSHLSPLGRGRTFALFSEGAGEGERRSTCLCSLALLISLFAFATPAHAEANHGAIAKATLSNVLRPGYAALAESTRALEGRVEALCERPSSDALAQAKTAFASTVGSWSKVEIYRFGPVNRDHRYERLFYWPDPKGLGIRQVQSALAAKDETVTEAHTLAKKSVALQGLPAIEYLLYADGSDALAEGGGDGAFRCRFSAAIARNMTQLARDIAQDWAENSTFAETFLDPGPRDPLYHAPKEVTLELFKALSASIESVRDQKLGKPLGESSERARPRLAAFWRSGLTFSNVVDNLQGVRTLFVEGGFAAIVAAQSPGVEDSILFDLDRVINVLGALDRPIAEAVSDEVWRAKLEALRVALKSARETAGDMISRGAGLSFGFNAMDGD